jgi:outer membrane protein OmpA-like peptidoglycan-associated protein
MVKTRCWSVTAVTAFLAATLGGCTHLVHDHDLDGLLDPVNAQLADHDTRITTLESDVASLQSRLGQLEQTVNQLGGTVNDHINDESLHCPCGLEVSLPVHFDFNRAEVRPVDQGILDGFAASVMANFPNAVVTVEGFADEAGSAEYNVGLSRRRAQSVKTYLVDQGMNGDNIRVAALGETRSRLVKPGETGATDPQSGIENRRVSFVLEWAGVPVAN